MATNPLHIALKRCDLLAVRQLLQQPAVVLKQQINEYDRGGETPLMRALQNRLLPSEIVQLLIDFGANPHQESKDFYGYHRPAVSIAISAGDVQKVELLINAGVTVNYMLSDGSDALLNALHGRDIVDDVQLLALLNLLLRHNVGVNTVTRHAESALRVLSREGRFDAVSLLLMAGADASQLNWTALAQAVAMGSIDDVKRCLATQADLEERDWWSRTPYLIAIQAGDIAKAQLLLDGGANPNVVGRCGKQPMVYAISNQHISMLNWLLEHGADIEQIDDFGDTCLIEAVERDNVAAVKVLLRAGANTSTRSKNKMPTALNLVDGSGEQLRKIAPDSSAIQELADLLDELKTLAIGEESSAASAITSTLCSAESVEQSALREARSVRVAQLLLDAGADPRNLTHAVQRLFLGYPLEPDEDFLNNTPDQFFEARERVFGTQNPELMAAPFWLAMIRAGVNGYQATRHFDGSSSFGGTPVWCAQRFGQTISFLNGGKIVQIGGEHEDHYHPDFCIYNDVFVHETNGDISIYGYPEDIFPPTDFHTATLMEGSILVIGGLGYSDTRAPGETHMFQLDLTTFAFRRIPATGNTPGWIYGHRAERTSQEELRVHGGTVVTGRGEDEQHSQNERDFVLNIRTGVWR